MRTTYFFGVLIAAGIIGGLWWYMGRGSTPLVTPPVTETPTNTYGMSQYSDSTYGFSFWYPTALSITATTTNDTLAFPGGIVVEMLQIGAMGDVSIFVVNSPTSTITDQPTGHASPIAQTKYFYDTARQKWMTAFPDSLQEGSARATTTADVSASTMARLVMLKSGKRFNTTIIPLSLTRFLVVTDGGGSAFTSQLAKTVAPLGAVVEPLIQAEALQAEAKAYGR